MRTIIYIVPWKFGIAPLTETTVSHYLMLVYSQVLFSQFTIGKEKKITLADQTASLVKQLHIFIFEKCSELVYSMFAKNRVRT